MKLTVEHPAPSSQHAGRQTLSIDTARPEQAGNDFRLGYRAWLDGLRGVAILLVLAFHLGLLCGGSLGVDVFFVLSGFLITTLLVEEWQRHGTFSLPRFYARRALRLWPAFFTLLALLALFSLWLDPMNGAALRREISVAGCYLANWPDLHCMSMPVLGYTWSLAVEEQFYLLWPVLLFTVLRLGLSRRQVLLLLCGGILACALLRMGLYRMHLGSRQEKMDNIIRLYVGLHTRADALLVGCLVGLLAAWNLLPSSRRFIRWCGPAALGSTVGLAYLAANRCFDHSQYYHGLFTAVALLVGMILVHLLVVPCRPVMRVLESRLLVGIGRLSYALYLFHMPLIYFLKPAGLGWHFPVETVLVAGLTLLAALASYYCIERPCLRVKRRFQAVAIPASRSLPVPLPVMANRPARAA